jgi:predicted nuclease of predicted toxin-antitoxin system
MRFYLDEDLSHRIAAIGRDRYGLDVISSHDVAMDHATDEEQLVFGAEQDRCIVTGNDRHFTRLTAEFIAHERPHAGVLIVPSSMPRQNFNLVARALAAYHALHPEPFISYLVDYLRLPADA